MYIYNVIYVSSGMVLDNSVAKPEDPSLYVPTLCMCQLEPASLRKLERLSFPMICILFSSAASRPAPRGKLGMPY